MQGSLLSAAVIWMLGSQATTRSAWLPKSVSTRDILQPPLWGVRGTWLVKGLYGAGLSMAVSIGKFARGGS